MITTTGYQPAEAAQMMTLSTFAYLKENSNSYSDIFDAIEKHVDHPDTRYATGTNWKLLWLGLTADYENLIYLVQSRSDANTIAFAIRGTDPEDPDDLFEDGDVFLTSTFPYLTVNDSSIVTSNGSQDGLNDLLTTAGFTTSDNGTSAQRATVQDHLAPLVGSMRNSDPVTIYVTGHSLGGTLATVFTSWLVYVSDKLGLARFPAVNLITYTFASPSVGNQSYADYYGTAQPIGTNIRFQGFNVFNPLDLVPYFCSRMEYREVRSNGWPWGLGGEAMVAASVEAMKLILDLANTPAYVQVSASEPLPSNPAYTTPPCWETGKKIEWPGEIAEWFLTNHNCNTYLRLLDAPIVPDRSSKMISGNAPVA